MFNRRRIEPLADGAFSVRLPRPERELLHTLPDELRLLLDEAPADPSLRRLFPPAYEDDADEAEYRRLVGDDLLAGRRRALETLAATAGRDRLSAAEAEAWLTALNDLRLVLGTRLEITEETDLSAVSPADPRAHAVAVYLYASWLQEQLVEAMGAGPG